MPSYLARLRASVGDMSQAELAEKLGLPKGYGQKKISTVESGRANLTPDEELRLAEIFRVPVEQLRLNLRNENPLVDLFSRIGDSAAVSLLVACYSGRPRIMTDDAALVSLADAIEQGLSVAMCVPYVIHNEKTPFTSSHLLLNSYYSRVWGSVVASWRRVATHIQNSSAQSRIAVYGPSDEAGAMVMPPFVSRYVLLVQRRNTVAYASSLFLMVESATSKQLHLIGSSDQENGAEQIEPWEAYFSPIIDYWKKESKLPNRKCAFWEPVSPEIVKESTDKPVGS